MPEITSESIDRLCTIEIRPRTGHVQRNVIRRLYEAARRKQGEKPLTYLAAKKLLETCRTGGHVFISTGAGVPPRLPKGEVDGMLGAAVLARALNFGLGVKPVLVAEARYRDPLVAATEAAGIPVLAEEMVRERTVGALFEAFPDEEAAAQSAASQLFKKYRPTAIIAIEKPARNKKGLSHSVNGMPSADKALGGLLISEAKSAGVASIGIGDGGNEIGMGLIEDAVEEVMPYGRKCQCPCGAGIASSVATDILMVANVSNWGAYGIAASMAAQHGGLGMLADVPTLRRMFEDCVRAGAMDGTSSRQVLTDDGVPVEAHESLLCILHTMVSIGGISLPQNVA